jgi:hypothetical protein
MKVLVAYCDTFCARLADMDRRNHDLADRASFMSLLYTVASVLFSPLMSLRVLIRARVEEVL